MRHTPARLLFALISIGGTQTAVYIARPVTSYKLLGLGAGPREVGLVTAAYALLPLFLAIPLGRFSDRRDPAPLLVAGCAVQALACVLLGVAGQTSTLAAATVLLGLGHLAVALGAQHAVARASDAAHHDRNFAALTLLVSIGQLVGPLIGGGLLDARGSASLADASGRAMYVAAGVAALSTGVAALTFRGGFAPAAAAEVAVAKAREILVRRGVPAGMFASLAALACADVITAYLPVLGEEKGIAPGAIGVLLALRALASIAARFGIVQLVSRFGRLGVLAASAALAAVALAGLAVARDPVVIGVLIVLAGYGLGFGQPLSMTMIVQRVPPSWAGTALAVRLTGNRFGQVGGPTLAGLVSGGAGVSAVFWVFAGAMAVSALAVQRPALRRDERRPTAPPDLSAEDVLD